ncbi:hypothetical protein D3C80_2076340 [compost metagenome]
MNKKAINSFKLVIAEKNLSSKWLCIITIQKIKLLYQEVHNEVQPPVKSFVKNSRKLNLRLTSLFND